MSEIAKEDSIEREERRPIYTPELENYRQTLNELTRTRSKIFELKTSEREKLDGMSTIKARITAQVHTDENEDGKKVFSNKEQRESEIIKRLRDHDNYTIFKADFVTFQYEKEMQAMKIEDLKKELTYWKLVIETLNSNGNKNV